MAPPRIGTVSYLLDGRYRRLSFRAFGDPAAPRLVCVHGLTRVGADFDAIAEALSDRYYVVSPDLPGRGRSDWLDDFHLYGTATYVTALSYLFASLGGPVDYIGTSLGGLCAIMIAAMPGQPIGRLVLNDCGPFVPVAALTRIRDYLCAPAPRFANVEALRLYLRRVHAPFGPLTDAQWLKLAADSARDLPQGGVALHYDPAIATAYAANPLADLDLWACWEQIGVPVLVLRGEHSDVLTPDILTTMQRKARAHVVRDTGHAPALLDAPTIAAVRDFLQA